MELTEPTLDRITLLVAREVHVRAPLDVTFESLLEQVGPANESPGGAPLSLVLEPWPGGRWWRDLGAGNGHLWGLVQAIKRPTLLEICGPLFMSAPVLSNVQYRLAPAPGGTLMTFRHSAFGLVPEEDREGLSQGWARLLEGIQARAEARRNSH
jgi:hypothetical protein